MGILKIPRITEAQRTTAGFIPEEGELLYNTTNDKIYKGDGTTAGGVEIGGGTGGGLKSGSADYTVGNENLYTVTISGVTGYVLGDTYAIKFLSPNTDAITIDITGQGQKDVYKNGNLPLVSGDIQAGQEFILIYDGTNFQILGIAPTQIFAFVTNVEGSILNKGDVVYSFGAQGNRMSVKKASNADDTTSSKTLGFVFSSTIGVNGTGYVITQGVIDKMNLGTPWVSGDPVWLGATAGTFTRTKPVAPAHSVYLGVVEKANSGNGQIYVKVQNGYELNEIHDVLITSPAANDFLVRNDANTLWVNETPANARASLGATTIGSNLFTLTNPGAITFPRFNADNTISTLSASDFRTAIGATTVGSNIFTATNPSAVRFIRVNADNTITFRTAAELVTDLGVTGGTTDLSYTASTRLLESSSGTDVTLPLFSAAAPSGSTTDAGLVPGVNSTNTNLFLRSDRSWASPVASGTIASGTARRLALYTGTGTALGDLFTQSGSFTLNVILASTAITASRTITIPVNDTANVEFVMNAGAQTIAGLKTFSTFTSYGNTQTQAAPNLTSRSAGSRVLIHEAFTASTQTDYAIGTESNIMWYSVPQATSTFIHRWYGGATALMDLRGDGQLTLAGQEIISSPTTLNYLPATLSNASPSITNYPLQVRSTYGTTNYAYSNIVQTTVTASYTSITANATGVTITGTGMSTFTQGTAITLSNVTGITGLALATNYFVISSSATTITLASTFVDSLNSIPLKTASGTATSGTATANYVEVTGIGTTGPAFTALTNGTYITLSNINGLTAPPAANTVYYSVISGASSIRLSTTFTNSSNGIVLTSLTGTYNTLAYTGITTGAEVVVSGTSLPALTTGTAVYLSNTTGITGLNTTTIYYVYASVAGTSLKLASTSANATAGTPITTATGNQIAGGNLRGVLSVGVGPTRGTGMTFWSGGNNPNGAFTSTITGSIDSQIAPLVSNTNRFDYDLVFKTGDGNTSLTEKFRIHSPNDSRGITIGGTIGSYTGTLTSRHPVNINASDNPATTAGLTITSNNSYGWMRFTGGVTNVWPSTSAIRPTSDRIILGDAGNGNSYPSIGFTGDGLNPTNGNSFWTTAIGGFPSMNFSSGGGNYLGSVQSQGGFNFFVDGTSSTSNVGFGVGVSPPAFSFSRSGFTQNTIFTIRSPRFLFTNNNKTISNITNQDGTTITLTLNNVTNLLVNQVVTLSNVLPTEYNNLPNRITAIDSVNNTVTMLCTITSTYTSGGTLTPVFATGGGGNIIGIYFDKDDDLIVSGSTGFPRSVAALNFIRSGQTTGTFGLFADTNITQKVSIATNSTDINIGENLNRSSMTFNLFASGYYGGLDGTTVLSNNVRTVNIATGGDANQIGYSTTNINIGNANTGNNIGYNSQTYINIYGRLAFASAGYVNVYFMPSNLGAAGGSFAIPSRTLADSTSAANSTIATRTAVSFATPNYTGFSTNTGLTITNAINVYIGSDPTTTNSATYPSITLTNSWGLWSDGKVRVANTTASTASTNGALVVSGGVGIAGALYVGGAVGITGNVGFYGTSPVVKGNTGNITGLTVGGSGGTAVTTGSTFGGYTIAQIAAALQRLGLIT